MQGRGHEIALISNPRYQKRAEDHGWLFGPICSSEEYERRLRDVTLLRSGHFILFAEKYFRPWNVTILNYIRSIERPQDTLMISVPAAKVAADLMAHAYLKIPLVRAHLEPPFPSFLRRFQRPVPSDEERRRSLVYDRLLREVATDQGFSPRPDAMRQFLRSEAVSVRRVACWPEWFATESINSRFQGNLGFVPPPDSDRSQRVQGFEADSHIVFLAGTMGTTEEWAERFFATSVSVCQELSRDCVLLGGTREDVPAVLPRGCRWYEWLPLEEALENAAAVVHHGGIGTIGQGLRAGVPQLVIPRAFMQHSNAAWMERLGVGRALAESSYYRGRVARILGNLLQSSRVKSRCAEYQNRCGESDVLGDACEVLENEIRRPLSC